MSDIAINVGDIGVPRYVEVFDTTMNVKEYFSTLQEAAAYMQVAVSKIVDALCADVEVRIRGKYRVAIVTETEDDEEVGIYERDLDVLFKNYRTEECVIVSSIKEAKLKTGIDEVIISKRLEEDSDLLASEFIFRKACVETIRPWPVFTTEQLEKSKTAYFDELKQHASCFYKIHAEIDTLLKSLLHDYYIEMQTTKPLTTDQRKQYLPLLDKAIAIRYGIEIEPLVQRAKSKVRELKRELNHSLDEIEEHEKEIELELEYER